MPSGEPQPQIWMRSNQQFMKYRADKFFVLQFWKMATYGYVLQKNIWEKFPRSVGNTCICEKLKNHELTF